MHLTPSPNPGPGGRAVRGVSLIEVLVAMLVVSLGVLAMVGMQVNATKLTKTSEVRLLGSMLASDLADRMRANRQGFLNNSYTLQNAYPDDGLVSLPAGLATTATSCDNSVCSSDQLAAADLADWQQSVYHALPNGSAWISPVDPANTGVDVWLVWNETNEAFSNDRSASECPSGLLSTSAKVTPRCMYFHITL